MFKQRKAATKCECSDPGCPVHEGSDFCANKSTQRLHRIDMDDEEGTRMCEACAEDACASGVFA